MTARLVIAGTAAAITAAVLLLGGVVRGGSPAAAPRAASAEALTGGFSPGDTAGLVRELQLTLRAAPRDVHELGLLGLAYQQRARETGDPAWYAKSDGVLRRALRLEPRDLLATSGLGSLALSRHRFGQALSLGRRARALSPSTARSYGVIGDALVELGRYREAFRAFDTMARLKPGLAAYARVAYARELLGDVAGARRALLLALDSAVGEPEAIAWTHVQLAKLALGHGRVADPAREARAALRAFLGYVYGFDVLAQVEAARGRLRAAIRLERQAAETIPLPQFVGLLGDLYRVTGRPVAATAPPSVDRRRRRPRLDTRTARPLRGGARLVAARAAARHRGRGQVLPPRDDRALPRPRRRGPDLVPPRARAEPALLGSLGTDGKEARTMKRLLLLLGLLAALLAPAAAFAHPLGNFTINRFSRVEVSGDRLYVRYVLDLAEIPTFQARQQGVDPAVYARRIAAGLRLTVDGRPARLRPLAHRLAFPRGAGGLRTMRLEVALAGPRLRGPAGVRYRDGNYAGRIGWKEIVVGAEAPSRSDELRAYPKDLLQSPLEVTAVSTRLAPLPGPAVLPLLPNNNVLQAPDRVADSGFARLIGRRHLSALVILASLAAALFWGAAHALSPGHGKTIVTAYLVGRRGTPWHAALLGLIVTATHTVGVFSLGLVTLALSQFLVPDRLYPWLNLVSGLLVVGIGISVLRARWRHARHHHHDHDHAHEHRSLVAVGISGGLLPCPSALVVLLAAISLHRIAFGLLLIVAFSAGLALTITGIGLAAILARRAFAGARLDGRLVSALPALSALVIVGAGIAMTLHAVPKVR